MVEYEELIFKGEDKDDMSLLELRKGSLENMDSPFEKKNSPESTKYKVSYHSLCTPRWH